MSRTLPIPSVINPACGLALGLFIFFSPSNGQTSSTVIFSDTLKPTESERTLRLSHLFVVTQSDSVFLRESGVILTRGREYNIDYRYGIVHFDSLWIRDRARAGRSLQVIAGYRYLPFRFQDRYERRILATVPTGEDDSIRIAQPQTGFDLDDIFGANLQKSGSIVRGITVGSNRDFSVNSGLRLQLAGKLATDVDVVASLTDENTPIQPEGTTQTLQEFDKVFVELRGTSFDVVLGDFNIEFEGSRFARMTRKLQGAKGTGELGSRTSVRGELTLSGAVPRGKFHTNQFSGIEGVQGPYRLTGRNGESEIIVIAGTERVFLDGERMVRGEINDYTIDYSLGELTFTSRRLINAASRITVDFEFTDRQFGRSFFAAQGKGDFFEEKIALAVSVFREGDDKDDPIDFAISDSARQILEEAGDDRGKAVVSGIAQVDSNGFYVRVDTLIAGDDITFYRYDPGPDAMYVISFSFVGAGQGDYVRERIGVFTWKGSGEGDYLPIRFLPIPQLHNVIDYSLILRPLSDLTVMGEFAQSEFDANTFSSVDGEDNNGHAFDLSTQYAPRDVQLFGSTIGSFDLQMKGRFIDENFVPIDRINEIEFKRKWGVDSLRNLEETIGEVSVQYLPVQSISVGGGYGTFERGDLTSSTRREASVTAADSALPQLRYLLENIESSDQLSGQASVWTRHLGLAEYTMWNISPTFRFENEDREIRGLGGGGNEINPGSFRFNLMAPGIRIIGPGPLQFLAEYEWRADDQYESGSQNVVREANSFTQSYQVMLRGLSEVTSTLDLTFRNRDVTPVFEATGDSDVRTVLIRNQTRYGPQNRWFDVNAFYEASTQQSAILQRVFVKVTPGTGNYTYLGDLNNNGVADESEFVLTRYDGDFVSVTVPGDEFMPVIDLNTSLRVSLRPGYLLGDDRGTVPSVLSVFSAETYYRIDEKSTEEDLKKIYLLQLGSFLNGSTTITGSQFFTQDLWLLERNPLFSTRFRFLERKSLGRFSSAVEKGYVREQSVRIRSQFVTEFSQQLEYIRKLDQGEAQESLTRNRDILANTLSFDLSYRPEQNFELGLKLEVTTSTDRFPEVPVDADINSQAMRAIYSFQGLGQARAELTREEVVIPGSPDDVSFELTGGRSIGRTWLWRFGFDYRVARFVQATVSYDGRSEGGDRTVHTARAEVQAFF